jgi:hypothetical protein
MLQVVVLVGADPMGNRLPSIERFAFGYDPCPSVVTRSGATPVAGLAEQKKDWAAAMSRCSLNLPDGIPVDESIQVTPAVPYLQISLIRTPLAAAGTALAVPTPPEFVDQERRLPVPHRLAAKNAGEAGTPRPNLAAAYTTPARL